MLTEVRKNRLPNEMCERLPVFPGPSKTLLPLSWDDGTFRRFGRILNEQLNQKLAIARDTQHIQGWFIDFEFPNEDGLPLQILWWGNGLQ